MAWRGVLASELCPALACSPALLPPAVSRRTAAAPGRLTPPRAPPDRPLAPPAPDRPDVGARHHCTALMALVALVNKHPATLMRHLPAVVEAVIRSLDPSEPELRKGCLRASTRALHELVKRYPMVSFHQETQRYAVGTVEAAIIIYDLRTATKWRILSGHTHPVAAVAFVHGGEVLASYSAEGACVKACSIRKGWGGGAERPKTRRFAFSGGCGGFQNEHAWSCGTGWDPCVHGTTERHRNLMCDSHALVIPTPL